MTRTPQSGKNHRINPIKHAFGKATQLAFQFVSSFVPNDPFDSADVGITLKNLFLTNLHSNFDGYQLVHISDIHMGTWIDKDRLNGAVEIINHFKADMVVITGDFLSYMVEPSISDLVNPLKCLHAKDAIIAVLGNHDHWTDPEAIRSVLDESGIVELNNDVYTVRREQAEFHIAGVDDPYTGNDRLDLVLERIPETGAAVLLSHTPDFADISAQTKRFDLQLSGHSHGGQVSLPLLGAPVLPQFARKYHRGLYNVNGMLQYTNRGLGTTTLQIRWNCPPEIAVFTLRAGCESGGGSYS